MQIATEGHYQDSIDIFKSLANPHPSSASAVDLLAIQNKSSPSATAPAPVSRQQPSLQTTQQRDRQPEPGREEQQEEQEEEEEQQEEEEETSSGLLGKLIGGFLVSFYHPAAPLRQ